MKHEIIELHNVQIIGMAKKIAFNEAKEECPKFWGEYVEKIIKPVIFEKQEPNAFKDVMHNMVFGHVWMLYVLTFCLALAFRLKRGIIFATNRSFWRNDATFCI